MTVKRKIFKISFKEEDASESEEEEVPEVVEEKRKGSRMEEEGTLNLTLEEVRHIRTALTRAELEVGPFSWTWKYVTLFPPHQGLPPSVSQGRLCFSCMNSKFGLFWRGQPCSLCSMLICGKCVNKVRFPRENEILKTYLEGKCPENYDKM